MTGLDEARKFYEDCGRAMLHDRFPDYEGRIAVGLAGHGSQCFGYDDALSRDHDFAPGFCLWLTDADDARIGAALAQAYRALPAPDPAARSVQCENTCGVRRTLFFYSRYTGSEGLPEGNLHWLSIPSWALAEATNGAVFRDDLGEFTRMREVLLHGMPEDVRLKKLAARCASMAQSGQYNYTRCLAHGEEGAAMLAAAEFVSSAADAAYLLNRRHKPYYKWALRGMETLPVLGALRDALTFLLTGDNDAAGQKTKAGVIEDVSAAVIGELKNQKLTDGAWDYLEPHAYEIQARIGDPALCAMPIMEG